MERKSREVWTKRVERWQDSGLSVKEFAREVGVNPHTLAGWRWRLKATASAPAKASELCAQAVPQVAVDDFVEIVRQQPSDERIEVVMRSTTVRVPAKFDADALRRLFALLEHL